MAAIMLPDLSDETFRALERRAFDNGRSLELEIRDILDAAVVSEAPGGIGSTLAAFGRRFGGIDLDIRRDPTPARAADFDGSSSIPT